MPFTINVSAGMAAAPFLLELQSVGLQQSQEMSNIYARVGRVCQVGWILGPGAGKKLFGLFNRGFGAARKCQNFRRADGISDMNRDLRVNEIKRGIYCAAVTGSNANALGACGSDCFAMPEPFWILYCLSFA